MSDSEHELIIDNRELHESVAWLSDLALRSLTAATDAQDAAFGRHDSWLEDALTTIRSEYFESSGMHRS